ncbi:hypothetical protein CEQ07_03825 [Oligella urethralis]|uniref:PriCT-2 domain-containing protein n=1 Tax=Oligella urethralis TaxID=90245 RepID=UPI000CFF8FD5|nr:PriCT-2 domain-containing protein [Oligella urethralis]AVL70632.1 hypothetical protein CEQ07_03825 [Oligella urethralis]
MNSKPDISTIQNALNYIDPFDRTTWFKVGAALKTELGDEGFQIWDDWSQNASNYKAASARQVWKSMRQGMIGVGTLFKEAQNNGFELTKSYKPLSAQELKERKEKMEIVAARAAKEREIEKEKAAKNSAARFNKAERVDPNHPYLIKKGIEDPKVLRYIRQEDDKLLIPVKSFGKIVGSQTIDPNGRKMFEKGMGFDGASMIIGSWNNALNEGVILAEGFATGASLHEATGMTTLVGFTGHNMTLVAKQLENTKFPVIVAADYDAGAGLQYAKQAAAYLGERAVVVMAEFSEQDKDTFKRAFGSEASDFNDLYLLKGKSAVRQMIGEAYQSLFQDNQMEQMKEPESRTYAKKEREKSMEF